MALPHRVVGLICELGRADRAAVTLENGDQVPAEQEDAFQLRKHVHLGDGDSTNTFEYTPSGNHHYFANFPQALLTEMNGTLNTGSYDGTPYRWDVEGQTYTVRTSESADNAIETDDLPSWLKAWIEPVSCANTFRTFDLQSGGIGGWAGLDEGHPEFSSSQSEGSYNETSARNEAEALFNAYLAVLRPHLYDGENEYSVSEAYELYPTMTLNSPIYPRWKSDEPYTEIEAVPFEKAACPLQSDFICPDYKSLSADTVEPIMKHRQFYDFSFSTLNCDFGPWKVTDQTPEHHPEVYGEYQVTISNWIFDMYVQNQYPDMGMSDRFPNHPPYWTDEDQNGYDDTWWTPYGHEETYTETYYYFIPAWDEHHVYEFDYPDDVKPSYTSKSRWKIKCEWNPEPPCCSPEGKQITFGIRTFNANMRSSINNEPISMQSPTTRYRNCHIHGWAKGEMGSLEYFDNYGCGPQFSNDNPNFMPWVYYGTVVRPVFSTSSEEGTMYVTKTIGEDWNGDPAFDIEIPASDGIVTYIADFWVESIT